MFVCVSVALISLVSNVRATNIPRIRNDQDQPGWTQIISTSTKQIGSFIALRLITASQIPHSSSKECLFEFVLHPVYNSASTALLGKVTSRLIIQFDLTHWDGSPWFATNVYMYKGGMRVPSDSSRMFDWKLTQDTVLAKFSLDGLSWSSVDWFARISYGGNYVSRYPQSGYRQFKITGAPIQPLEIQKGLHSRFIFPSSFKTVMKEASIPLVVSRAYEYEKELTGIVPVCGNTASYVFNRYYDGASIEGNPIGMGPGMWGKSALWFVYFHEMGHDFCNASARFRQLYPLTMGLPPGPLPANILFYEGWASLPAMYAFDRIVEDSSSLSVSPKVYESIKVAWVGIEKRFTAEWEKYKSAPVFAKMNPDIVDGMFLEFHHNYGWRFFKEFYALMRPQDKPLAIFKRKVSRDSTDLRITRCTLTAAIFSALAHKDLKEDFQRWDFPIDLNLFHYAYDKLLGYLKAERIRN